jgi:hypothetical protein
MAQASSSKPSIRYQVCNSAVDNDLTSTKPSQRVCSPHPDDDLCEITISPTTNKKASLSSPNHHTSLVTHLIPAVSSGGHTSSSAESATLIKPIQSSILQKNLLGSSSSIHSLSKRTNIQQRPSIPVINRQSFSRQSIFDTLASTLTAVRKSSTSALTLAQQRLSTDNGSIFAAYQGKISGE